MDTSRPSIYFRAKQISPILRRHLHRVTFIRITRRSFSISIHHFRKNFPILFLLLEIVSLSLSITSLATEFDVSIRDPRVIPIAWNPPGRKTLACKQPQGELPPPSSFAFEIRLPLKSKFQSPPLKGSDWIVECLRYFVSITFLWATSSTYVSIPRQGWERLVFKIPVPYRGW